MGWCEELKQRQEIEALQQSVRLLRSAIKTLSDAAKDRDDRLKELEQAIERKSALAEYTETRQELARLLEHQAILRDLAEEDSEAADEA